MVSRERDVLRVILCTSYPLAEGTAGGVKDFTLGLARELESSQGCLVRTIAPRPPEGNSNLADYQIGRAFSVRHNKTIHDISITSPGDKRRMREIFVGFQPDIINHQEAPNPFEPHTANSAAPKRRDGKHTPRLIGTFHAQVEKPGFLIELLKFSTKTLMRRPRFRYGLPVGLTEGALNTVMKPLVGRIAVSKATAESAERIYKDHAYYEIIHNGVDITELKPEGPTIPEWEDGKLTIFATGRHDPRKDFETTIRAFAELKKLRNDVKLVIGGFGEETNRLLALVEELGLPDIRFTGYLSRERLLEAYRTADLFISSATGGEGFGRILIEALASGTLVVGTDINGYREAIRGHDFTRLARPKDPKDQAEKMLGMLNLPEERKRILEAEARVYVEQNFAWPIIAKKTVDYYIKCLNKHGWPKAEDWSQRKGKLPDSGTIFVTPAL